VEKGEYVYMTDEDFEAAEVEGYKTIDITDFVPYDEIDPIFFEKTYYLGPQDGAEKVYALLLRAMEDAGLAAIAKYVMRDQQHLGALRVREGVIVLEKMYFADEIRPTDEIAPGDAKVDDRELEMAMQLIDRFSGKFEPEKYEDTYRQALLAIVEAKRKGKEVHVERAKEPAETVDLMEALRASLEAAKGRRGERAKARGSGERARGKSRPAAKRTSKKAAKKAA
jgi:DNA end-binding protein Ku